MDMNKQIEKLDQMFKKLESLDPKNELGAARIKLLRSTLLFIKAISESDMDHKLYIPVLIGFMETYTSLVSIAYKEDNISKTEMDLNMEMLDIVNINQVGEA